jgi:uncharacterized protein YegL
MNLRENKEKRKLHVAIVLDESGSMQAIKNETIVGLNEQIQELKKNKSRDIETTVTLVTFAGPKDVNIRMLLRPVEDVEEFTSESYKPDGATAMYDGVAKCIYSIKNGVKDDDQTNYLVLVVSDGQENASVEFTPNQVADLIKDSLGTKKWSINYIGANQDLTLVSQTLCIPSTGSSYIWHNTQDGTNQMWRTLSASTATYCSSVANSNSAEDVKQEYFTKTI